MLHDNGNGNDNASWNRTEWISGHPDSWGLMRYYIDLPWSRARFFAKADMEHGKSSRFNNIVSDPNSEWHGGNRTKVGL